MLPEHPTLQVVTVPTGQRKPASTILKFHGRPKPEEVLHPWRHPQHTILRHPLHPRLWGYQADEVRRHWH